MRALMGQARAGCKGYAGKRFRSLLFSSTLGSVVSLIAVLMNNMIAGNLLGEPALLIMTLASPYLIMVMALEVLLSAGAAVHIAIQSGRGDMGRVDEFFSGGVLACGAGGVLLAAVSLLCRDPILSMMMIPDALLPGVETYYMALLPAALISPMDCLLVSVILTEGDTKRMNLSVACRLLATVLLAWGLGRLMGVAGIALAYALPMVFSGAILCTHFRAPGNTLHFKWFFSLSDLWKNIKLGANDAMGYLFIALSTLLMNRFLMARFGSGMLAVFAVIQSLHATVTTCFDGIPQAMQPLHCAYFGEDNPAGVKRIMAVGLRAALLESGALALLLLLTAGLVPDLYGLRIAENRMTAVYAVRAMALCLPPTALNYVWNAHLLYIGRPGMAMAGTTLRALALRVLCMGGLGMAFGEKGIWYGFALAELLTMAVTYLWSGWLVKRSGGALSMPLLLAGGRMEAVRQYDFAGTQEGVLDLCDRLEEAFLERRYSRKAALTARLITEEFGMSLVERNPGGKVLGELSVAFAQPVCLTFRDDGETGTAGAVQETPEDSRGRILSAGGNRYQLALGDNKTTFMLSTGPDGAIHIRRGK